MGSDRTLVLGSLAMVFSVALPLTSRSLTLPPVKRSARSRSPASSSPSNLLSPRRTHSRSLCGTSAATVTLPDVAAVCGVPVAPPGPKGMTRTEISQRRSAAVTMYSGPSLFLSGVPARNQVYASDVSGVATVATAVSMHETTASP
eukprot:scaffold8346_cov119-Isochrysis_galbana.AAC.6